MTTGFKKPTRLQLADSSLGVTHTHHDDIHVCLTSPLPQRIDSWEMIGMRNRTESRPLPPSRGVNGGRGHEMKESMGTLIYGQQKKVKKKK